MNKFRFNPIGQGLFYTGSLMHGSFNFVYDCGTESKGQYLDNQICRLKRELSTDKKAKPYIDFVVISHLHKDHISGLFKLLTEFEVGDLYLPYFGTNKELFATYLAYALFGGENDSEQENRQIYEFMLSLYGYNDSYRRDINVHNIHNDEDFDSDKEPLRDKDEDGLVCSVRYLGGESLKYYWKFILINQHCCKCHLIGLNKRITDSLNAEGIFNVIDYIRQDANNINKLKDIYQDVFCKIEGRKNIDTSLLNRTSTMLLHYPLYKDSHIKKLCCKKRCDCECNCNYQYACCNFDRKNTVTLLTGDALIDDCMRRKLLYGLNGRNINILQVPHHGSKENWETLVNNKIQASTYVLPFGLGNRHKHPHTDTIDYLMANKLLYFCITQDEYLSYIID